VISSVETPFGPLVVGLGSQGVFALAFRPDEVVDLDESDSAAAIRQQQSLQRKVQKELDRYFAGKLQTFSLPLDRRSRRGFRGEVLQCLEKVEYGKTVSYGQLAANAKRPRAARAVGSTMATNPLAILVPCHRVLPANGSLGQYGGGVERKAFLLRLEGIEIAEHA